MENTTLIPCNDAGLDVFQETPQNPWSVLKVRHIYQRLRFSASQTTIDEALTNTPQQFIDSIIDQALNLSLPPSPFWGYYSFSDFDDYEAQNSPFIFAYRNETAQNILNGGLKKRLAFFWSNHFVTKLETYFYAPYLFQYFQKLEEHAIGNFKEFVREMGRNPAMLLFLNGFENTNNSPNENYARELFELFTLGEGNNYTQQDITEAARALTGYNHWDDFGGEIYFNASTFDAGNKVIFGQEGPWGYDDVINILFEHRSTEVANFIVTKLYHFFVSPTFDALIQETIIDPLVQTFIDGNWELAPVLRQLFKSEHFFDERSFGVVIKSPLDVIFNFINETNFFYNEEVIDAMLYYAGLMGQEIFDPPDVSGWQRDETWINSSTLTGRWEIMDIYLHYLFYNQGLQLEFADFAKQLTNNSNDPDFITRTLVNHFMCKELHTQTDYDDATVVFKWDVPQNYYDTGAWNLDWESGPLQVLLLLRHIVKMPEFQLK